MRKIVRIGFVILLLLICSANVRFVYAQEETDKIPINENSDQKCGDLAYYDYNDETNTLTIFGKGEMYDFSIVSEEDYVPWNDIKDDVEKIVIYKDITNIGAYAFNGFSKLVDIDFGNIKTIGSYALKDCVLLKTINIKKDIENISLDAFSGCVFNNIIVDNQNTNYKIVNNSLVDSSNMLIKATSATTIADSIVAINKNAFENLDIETIFIPSTVLTINSNNKEESIFKGCSKDLKIYTNATSDLAGWGSYYKYYNQTNELNVIYNTTLQEYTRIINQVSISFADLGLEVGSKVYLDGQPYVLDEDLNVVVDGDLHVKSATTYTIKNNDNEDVHVQYPTSMCVYFLSSAGDKKLKATKSTNFENILTYAGASIRIAGVKGIRTITSIPTAKKNQLINSNIDGYIVMEYGTVMCWEDTLEEGKEPSLYYDATSGSFKPRQGAKGRAYSRKDKMNTIYSESGGITKYTNTLVDTKGAWDDESCSKNFAMRSYMIIRPKDAKDSTNDIVIYGGTLYRSISYIALQNKNAFKVGSNGYEYIFKLIKAGYPDVYDEEYGK